MNPHQSPPLGQPSLPALTVPDKTLSSLSTTATASTTATGKRPPHSTATTTAAAPLHSPSLEVSDSFSTTGYSPTKPFLGHTLLRKSSESPFFTAIQTTALRNLCSSTAHPPSAPLWHTLLDSHKFTAPHSVQDISDLEMATVGLAIELAANNVTTHNFNALLLHLLSQLHRWQAAKLENVPASTLKALFLTRVFAKHFAGNLTNEQMIAQFEATEIPSAAVTESAESAEGGGKPLKTPTAGSSLSLDLQKLVIHPEVQLDTRPKGEQLLDHALSILITTDPSGNDSLYEFYVEVLNTLLVLFSTQFHHTHLGEGNYFLDILFQHFSHTSEAVIAKLLDNFIQQTSPPAQSSSVVYSAYNYFFSRTTPASDADAFPVADRSLLLLLLLSTQAKQYTVPGTSPPTPFATSPYRHALANIRDHHARSSELQDERTKIYFVSFKDLFEIFCRSLGVEERMLLFYLLLVENDSFRVYVLSRTDPETMYIPILKLIYESVEGRTNYSQVYVLLIFLLIFSQDDVNNESIQKITVSNISWFTERPLLKSISLGGLVSLVLIRTLQLNLSHQKDVYFHTNCLAILANMSTSMLDMHAYVAQRIVSLFELISKRYQKVTHKTPSGSDATVYEDLLALLLEIINSALTHRLKHNPQLVYALLLKCEIFAPFRLHSRFAELIAATEQVIHYFQCRVSEAKLKAPSSLQVLDLIEQHARTHTQHQRMTPDLKFQYEEEQDAHEFFVPYVWALIHRRTFIYWSEEKSNILDEYRQINEAEDTPIVVKEDMEFSDK